MARVKIASDSTEGSFARYFLPFLCLNCYTISMQNTLKPIKGIAFDLEGTVVDVEACHHNGHMRAAREMGVELGSIQNAISTVLHFIGGPDDAIAKDIYKLSDMRLSEEAFVGDFLVKDKTYYRELLATADVTPRPGVLKFLEAVRAAGIKTSIGSLTAHEEVQILLDRSGLSRVFSRRETVLREDVKNTKPAPDVFIETARRMGIDPQEQLVFEDSPRGVQAALAAGSQAVGMPVYEESEIAAAIVAAGATQTNPK